MTEPEAPSKPLLIDWHQYYNHQEGIPQHVLDQRVQAAKQYAADLAASQVQLKAQEPTLADFEHLARQAVSSRTPELAASLLTGPWRQHSSTARIIDVGLHHLLVQELTRLAKSKKGAR